MDNEEKNMGGVPMDGANPPHEDDAMKNEEEVLRLVREYQTGNRAAAQPGEPAPVSSPAPAQADAPAGPQEAAPLPDGNGEAVARRPVKEVLLDMLCSVIPRKGDAPLEIVRKCVFIVALLVLIGSVSYIIYDMVYVPANNRSVYGGLSEMYDPDNPAPLNPEYEDFNYPPGMDDAFKNLYPLNTDLRGWMTYTANTKNDFLKIDYPILWSGDNEKYLYEDFYGNKMNKNGALFFDQRNVIDSPESYNKVLIVYGHNMASGQMFSGLNKFMNSVNNVRSAPLITMNTLYHKNQYKVFAVILVDDAEKNQRYRFNYLRTRFNDDTDFLNYINEIRAHSMYDYNSVDVNADDELLVLSTCTNSRVLEDGRLAVIARRVRDGESTSVDTRQIVENEDVIMPYGWYTKHNEEIHPYYTDPNYTIPLVNITTTTTIGSGTTVPIDPTTGTGTGSTATTPTTTGSTLPPSYGTSTVPGTGTTTPPGTGTTAPPTSAPPTTPTGSNTDTTAPTSSDTEPTPPTSSDTDTTAPTASETEPTSSSSDTDTTASQDTEPSDTPSESETPLTEETQQPAA